MTTKPTTLHRLGCSCIRCARKTTAAVVLATVAFPVEHWAWETFLGPWLGITL